MAESMSEFQTAGYALREPLRERVVPHLPRKLQSYLRRYDVLPSFDSAARAGFSGANFDLSDNIREDQRAGLDTSALNEVRRLMDRYNLDFDDARLRRQRDYLKANGIDPDTGLPLDKRAITSLG